MSEKNKKELEILKWTIITYAVVNVLFYSIWLIVDYFMHGEYGNLLCGICASILICFIYRMVREYHENDLF